MILSSLYKWGPQVQDIFLAGKVCRVCGYKQAEKKPRTFVFGAYPVLFNIIGRWWDVKK